MRHARDTDLDALEPLIVRLRGLPGLIETKRGVFYRKSKAFLHFHEDPKGLFADVRTVAAGDFERIDVSAASGQDRLMAVVLAELAA